MHLHEDHRIVRHYIGRTQASASFRVYGSPEPNDQALVAAGEHLTTEEVVEALLEEARNWGWQG